MMLPIVSKPNDYQIIGAQKTNLFLLSLKALKYAMSLTQISNGGSDGRLIVVIPHQQGMSMRYKQWSVRWCPRSWAREGRGPARTLTTPLVYSFTSVSATASTKVSVGHYSHTVTKTYVVGYCTLQFVNKLEIGVLSTWYVSVKLNILHWPINRQWLGK